MCTLGGPRGCSGKEEDQTKKSWLQAQNERRKMVDAEEKDTEAKYQHAWQSGWDAMLHEMVAEEVVQREVEEKDQFKTPLQVCENPRDGHGRGGAYTAGSKGLDPSG